MANIANPEEEAFYKAVLKLLDGNVDTTEVVFAYYEKVINALLYKETQIVQENLWQTVQEELHKIPDEANSNGWLEFFKARLKKIGKRYGLDKKEAPSD